MQKNVSMQCVFILRINTIVGLLFFVGTKFLQPLHAVTVVHMHSEQTGSEAESPLALG